MARGALIALPLLVLACAHPQFPVDHSPSSVALPSQTVPAEPLGWQIPVGAERSERNRCIDRTLAELGEDKIPRVEDKTPGTESPLGVQARSASNYDRIMHDRPDIAVQCSRIPGEPDR
jgi:hypothetical protein